MSVSLNLQHTKGDMCQATSPSPERGSPGNWEDKHRLQLLRTHSISPLKTNNSVPTQNIYLMHSSDKVLLILRQVKVLSMVFTFPCSLPASWLMTMAEWLPYKWHLDLAQYWWIGVRQSFLRGVPVAQWIDYNNHNKKNLLFLMSAMCV